jgi:uncharacterized membrane-anchored protein
MKIKSLLLQLLMAVPFFAAASPPDDSLENYLEKYHEFVDSVNSTLKYETGKITLEEGKVILSVPEGFKYLGKEQSKQVLTSLWGNPESSTEGVLGMIFPAASGPIGDSTYAFVVSFSEVGYVKDNDADDIDYDELIKNLKKEEESENINRLKQGYEPVYLIGWAQKPFYDKQRKILHWAKEFKFGDGERTHTLNYEIRILGRKGMLSLNAVSAIDNLSIVNKDISKVLDIASFTQGNTYSDFNPDLDEVATWTIGGLVAGKLLAKAGLFAVILKFLAPIWKFLLLAILPIGAWMKKRFTKKEEQRYAAVPVNAEESENKDTQA